MTERRGRDLGVPMGVDFSQTVAGLRGFLFLYNMYAVLPSRVLSVLHQAAD